MDDADALSTNSPPSPDTIRTSIPEPEVLDWQSQPSEVMSPPGQLSVTQASDGQWPSAEEIYCRLEAAAGRGVGRLQEKELPKEQ